MGVPTQPLPTIGQPNSTEDSKVRSALSELQTILTAGIDATNVSPGKLASISFVNSASGISCTGSMADVGDMTVSVTPAVASYALVVAVIGCKATGAASSEVRVDTQLLLDGAGAISGPPVAQTNTAGGAIEIKAASVIATRFTLTAASHTIKAQASVTTGGGGGTAQAGGAGSFLAVLVIPQ
jgi:hypothetical protein